MRQPISRMNPPTLPNAALAGYSQITTVEPGRLAYISGQVARLPNGGPAPQSLTEQAKLVAANAMAALTAIDATPRDIVMARIYMVDLTTERLEEMMPHILAMFDGVQPSLTGVGVAALAGPDLQIEMELIVRMPD
ncbi:MAG TPA: RidA family protein [Kiritimatiellia bacterium]|nr:RidA family protein [Kiritimatiellia bacterium]